MWTNRLSLVLPSRNILVTAVVSSIGGAVVAFAVLLFIGLMGNPAPSPGPPHDPRFVSVGRAYLPQLGLAYAGAWNEGAAQLESGKSISAALDVVSKSWSSRRAQLYDHVLTPQFSRIVAESVKDEDVTPQERAALAAAWRGLSLGLAK
jgi:hypothetical protein